MSGGGDDFSFQSQKSDVTLNSLLKNIASEMVDDSDISIKKLFLFLD